MVVNKAKRERFERMTQAANLVIGAVLGAYLGLGLTKTEISIEAQFGLFFLLVSLSVFAGMLVGLSGYLSEKKSWKSFILYFVVMGLSLSGAYVSASYLGTDLTILRVILLAWILLVGFEVVILGTRRAAKAND